MDLKQEVNNFFQGIPEGFTSLFIAQSREAAMVNSKNPGFFFNFLSSWLCGFV